MLRYYYATYWEDGNQRFRGFTNKFARDKWVARKKAYAISCERMEKIIGKNSKIFFRNGAMFVVSARDACKYSKRRKRK